MQDIEALHYAHTIGTKSYATHRLNYFKDVNIQEAHRNDYYTNRVLFLAKHWEVLTVIRDKIGPCPNNLTIFCASNQGYGWNL